MIKIEVKSTVTQRSPGLTKKGKPYPPKQEAWAHLVNPSSGQPDPYPSRIRVTLWDDSAPYPPGLYTLSPDCIGVDDWGDLKVYPRLKPITASPAQKAA